MRRRDFISLVGGTAAWPLAARGQQPERIRRIGSLAQLPETDPELRKRLTAFVQTLQKLGWRDGQNIRIDYRYALGKADNARRYAAELIELAPDVILAEGNPRPLLEATRTVPIVFVLATDPVGAGLVESLAHPGGNATGFSQAEYATSGKWLELVKEVAPRVTRVAVLRDLVVASGTAQFGVIQSVASSLGVEVSPINMRDAGEIERGIAAFALKSGGGLIVTSSPIGPIHRDLIVALAARHQLPAVYHERLFVADGGLISYAPDFADQYRQAAGYVDRILKGEKPADLPVQQPTKFELVINLRTAKALGLTVPPTLLARADEVIE
jgi:putative ABC transport system substrate-binding protein